ncbi:DUF2905 domain-containing protein [Metallumcola ferriviriculae]|uniref:DUF2905 domain-containing protein n=1 Tax=Metallumcola ferriviriculae TaxID=3039180 RepID=A0AAU0UQ41_9FIRM|nr:DUF2905 domain-containing protein [Desulfitibacteraceae bacterium MK1]
MPEMSAIGKMLLGLGIIISIIGLILIFGGKLLPLGKLPGDIYIRKGNFTFYFPLVSGILISIILTILLNLLFRR